MACQCATESDALVIPLNPRLPPPSDSKSIFPHTRRFGVVQMDPVAMVNGAGVVDPIALREAETLVTKKYLVYLETIIDLPSPDSKWCRYNVLPVAIENPEWGITREMVLPIHPNTAHLVVPSPFVCQQDPAHTFEFRFKSCFLWVESDTVLRLRVRRGDDIYDNSKAIPLTFRQHFETINSFGPYLDCITRHLQKQGQKKGPTRPSTAARTGTPSIPLTLSSMLWMAVSLPFSVRMIQRMTDQVVMICRRRATRADGLSTSPSSTRL